MNFKIITYKNLFLFCFFINNFYYNNFYSKVKESHQDDICNSCSYKIEEYRKQIKDLESMISSYRKEITDLLGKYSTCCVNCAQKVVDAYELYEKHLRKCTG